MSIPAIFRHSRLLQQRGFAGRFWLAGLLTISSISVAHAQQAAEREPVVVVSDRYPDEAISQRMFGATALDREEIAALPQDRLDEVLRAAAPSFSLFRRTSSEVGHPTTQGPGLRNIGPNGAGRVLVLLDGVPQNDPFGGWVYWQRLPPSLLGGATVVRGGGAGLFGNNALGGTIYLTRHQPEHVSASLMAGERDSFSGTLGTSMHLGPLLVSTTLHGQTTAGYPVVRADQRGPVDIRADSSAFLFETGISTVLDSGTEVTVRGSWFEEERGNGTPYTGNRTEALDLSVGFRGPEGDVRWESVLFYQGRSFESTFSSVNEDRTTETPALDQYDVPAHALGFSFTTTFAGGISLPGAESEGSKLIAGVDARHVQGETRELFRFMEGSFLNDRQAGGRQLLTGLFAEQTWRMSPALLIVLGGRLDYWQVHHGRRVERVRASGASLLDESFPDRDGLMPSGRIGFAYDFTESVQWRAAAYTGFRVPTLNELYRPFRVRNDVTGANASLDPEQLIGVETGLHWEPVDTLRLGATVFWNRLSDAVTNVTVLEGPGTAPDGTFIPDGGAFRRRQNVDAVTTTGVELEVRWQPATWLDCSAAYLFTHTEVNAGSGALDGRELAQAPAHVLTGALAWKPDERWQVGVQARYGSDQFEDDLNALVLDSYVVWDAIVSCRVREDVMVSVVLENAFDRTVETGRSADGLVSIGAPRWLGVKVKWEF